MPSFAFFQNRGTIDLVIVALVLVSLLMLGDRSPSVMRSLGESVTEFKKAVWEMKDS